MRNGECGNNRKARGNIHADAAVHSLFFESPFFKKKGERERVKKGKKKGEGEWEEDAARHGRVRIELPAMDARAGDVGSGPDIHIAEQANSRRQARCDEAGCVRAGRRRAQRHRGGPPRETAHVKIFQVRNRFVPMRLDRSPRPKWLINILFPIFVVVSSAW